MRPKLHRSRGESIFWTIDVKRSDAAGVGGETCCLHSGLTVFLTALTRHQLIAFDFYHVPLLLPPLPSPITQTSTGHSKMV
jgi:hypothetical protein